MLQPLAIAVIGGLTISMSPWSLVVTPVIYYLLTRNRHDQEEASAVVA